MVGGEAQIKLTEMKNTMSEMRTTLDGSNSRLDVIEADISEFKDVTMETILNETERETRKENTWWAEEQRWRGRKKARQELSASELWDDI